jgi:beta-galactosidase
MAAKPTEIAVEHAGKQSAAAFEDERPRHRVQNRKGIERAVNRLSKRNIFVGVLGVFLTLLSINGFAEGRLTLNFNPDWKFIKADPSGASTLDLDDRGWSQVSAPHTYNDTDTFDDWSLPGHRGEQNQWSGRTWYRKSFNVPASYRGKRIYLEFEGVRQIAEVYLNGTRLGVSKTGFTPFGFDLTPYLRFGATNLLAVMCDNRFMKDPVGRESMPEKAKPGGSNTTPTTPAQNLSLAELSAKVNATIPEDVDQITADQLPWNNPHWHPAHGGIYRNVYLHVVDPLHILLPLYSFLETTGPYVYASDILDQSARVNVAVPIQNGRASGENVEMVVTVLDHDGKPALVLKHSESIAASARAKFKVSGTLEKPQLWEPSYPYLYRVRCALRVGGTTVDSQEIPLGIRTVRWDAQSGFYINGHPLKLRGWGQKPTDEWPGLGAALPDWMHYYTLALMKEAGGNFIRWGHCAAGPASITASDRLGIIADQPGVDGESDTRGAAWILRAAAFRDVIIYYRNHPSILIWEGGNQKVSREHAQALRGYVDQFDPHGGRAYAHRRADPVSAELMNVGIGTEGGREIARLPVVEGEYNREESPRRVWDDFSPPNFGYPEAKGQTYQLTSEQYAVNQVAQYVRKLGAPYHCGGANWIFSDSTSGGRVACEVARASGEVDGVRLAKEAYYVCRTLFRADPQVHIIGHWNYSPETRKTVYVVSNGEDVELFVNGKSLGHGTVSDRYLFTFPKVAWEAGEIKAVASAGGRSVATQMKRTIGAPAALRLTPITGPDGLRADGSDVALIDIEAIDAQGERCPSFQARVDFEIEGPGIWRGGYNSGKIHSINYLFLDLECGINRVSVRATRTPGVITVRAKCSALPELKPGQITIPSAPVEVQDGCATLLPLLPAVFLPKERIIEAPIRGVGSLPPTKPQTQAPTGRFIKAFAYSGPTTRVHVEPDAQDGKKIYADREDRFAALPMELKGSDYVQAAHTDTLYAAADLMEIAAKAGAMVWVAHDNRLPRPDWLIRQFKATGLNLAIAGQRMQVFQRIGARDESLTLGANTEKTGVNECHMYIVFVNVAPVVR